MIPISEQVRRLEEREKELTELVGEIIATIEINCSRGNLSTADDDLFEKIRESWRRRRDEIEAKRSAEA